MAIWTQTADGGRSAQNTAKQHAAQVKYLVSCYKPRSLEELLNSSEVCKAVESRVNSGEWRASTGKLYYGSLKHFLSFLIEKNESGEIPILSPSVKDKVILILNKIPRWKTAFRNTVVAQKTELFEKQRKLIHSKEKIDVYMESDEFKYVKELINTLDRQDNTNALSVGSYCRVVRCLMSLISIRAPKRAGVLGGLLISDFLEAELLENGTYNVTLSGDHKTKGPQGSAIVPISATTHKWLSVYVDKVRSHITPVSDKDYLFVKSNGTCFGSGEVSKMLTASFESAGLNSTNATIFRKSTVTETYKNLVTGEEPDIVASLLDHDVGTGRREYNLFRKDKRANEAAVFNESLMFSQPLDTLLSQNDEPSTSQKTDKGKTPCEKVFFEQRSDLGLDHEYSALYENLTSSSDESDSSEAITVKKPTKCNIQRGSKESFSLDMLNLVNKNCEHMIKGSAKINLNSIQSCGINDVISRYGATKLMSKIRYLRLKYRNQKFEKGYQQ